ncbi:MAG: hypothetical protein HY554_05360 [Elusimicrobia bacterium]|nr:hypothetical protein [Elusimicrobiota bacterium]
MLWLPLLCFAAVSGSSPTAWAAETLRGRLRADRREDFSAYVVWIADGAKLPPVPPRPGPEEALMTQKDKAFSPRTLAIRAGGRVRFLNRDAIYHNVFSPDPRNPFDIGMYRKARRLKGSGPHRTLKPVVVFEQAGMQSVFCDLHPDMEGVVHVFDHGYYAMADKKGFFTLPWSGGSSVVLSVDGPRLPEPRSIFVNLAGADGVVEVALELERYPVVAPHARKDGTQYRSSFPGQR